MSDKVFGIGLPRCAGQTLQQALAVLTGRRVWHSANSLGVMADEDLGAVECWFPVPYLEKEFPGSKYIVNVRDVDAWLRSCESVYSRSSSWNNPLWKYPLDSFRYYRDEYLSARLGKCSIPDRVLVWDVTEDPCWGPLCDFLHVSPPAVPFPRVDRVKDPLDPPPFRMGWNSWDDF